MHRRTFCALAASSLAFLVLGVSGLRANEYRLSGPIVHENLAIYLVHGKSAGGAVPLTLDEAIAKRAVKVHETGNVNELQVENLGSDEMFVQSGDIVKGGQQDRVLSVSLILPPKSGRINDRGVLRRAGPLVGARQGRREDVHDRVGERAVARGEARDPRARRDARGRLVTPNPVAHRSGAHHVSRGAR